MKSYAQFEFSDGSIRAINFKSRGIKDAETKCRIVANWLEIPGERELVRWECFYNRFNPGMDFLSIPYRGKLNKYRMYFYGRFVLRHELAKSED